MTQPYTSMTLQYTVIILIIVLSAAYAIYRLYLALREDSQCAGCALKDNCAKTKCTHNHRP